MNLSRIVACAALVAGVSLTVLTSCTRPEEAGNTLVFSFWGSVEQTRVELAVVQAFEAANPGVKVIPQPISPPIQRYNDKLQAMFVGQVAPDVVMIEMSRYDEWSSRGVLEDLTAQVETLSERYELMPVPRKVFSREGRFYAMPINAHGHVTYFNRNAIEEAGVEMPDVITWEWLAEVAPKLSKRAGSETAKTDYAFQLPFPTMIFWGYGARLFDDPFNPTKSMVNTPEGIAAVNCIRRLMATGAVLPPEIGTMTTDIGTYQLFRDGRIAFFFSGRWSTPDFLNIKDFFWDVRPLPGGPAGTVTQHGGTLLGVWSGSKNKELAKRFIEFYASDEGMKPVLAGRRTVPVFRKIAEGPEFLALTPPRSLKVFVDTMEEGAASHYLYAPGLGEAKRLFDDAMERAMVRPDIPTETILSSLEVELNRWIAKRKQ